MINVNVYRIGQIIFMIYALFVNQICKIYYSNVKKTNVQYSLKK
jgi:hypothetical protein